jgi:hypothetical protein
MGFQVVVPELGRGFHRLECAQSARALAPPGSRVAIAPLAAVVAPIAFPAAAPAGVAAIRHLGAPALTLGLLAAGTAAASLLWLQVLSPDPTGFALIRTDAPRAAADETVEARVSALLGPATPAEQPAAPREDTARPIVISTGSASGGASARGAAGGGPSTAARRPSNGGREASQGGGKHDAKGKSKGHHARGLGHLKHGDSTGNHSPGHGNSPGAASNSGHGKSHGHGKKN